MGTDRRKSQLEDNVTRFGERLEVVYGLAELNGDDPIRQLETLKVAIALLEEDYRELEETIYQLFDAPEGGDGTD